MKNILFILVFALASASCKNESKPFKEITISKTEKVTPKLDPNNYNVAFLIMDGTYNTELTAPFDIFQHTIFR